MQGLHDTSCTYQSSAAELRRSACYTISLLQKKFQPSTVIYIKFNRKNPTPKTSYEARLYLRQWTVSKAVIPQ
jgi:hypothetical protein